MEKKTIYEKSKNYVLKYYKLRVSSLYIAKVNWKLGITKRDNYNGLRSGMQRILNIIRRKKKL